MDRKDIQAAKLYREMTLDHREMNDEDRTVPASLSSEVEVERFFGKEVLVHESKAVNLERAADGLPLLFGHNQDQPVGLVEDIRVEDGKLRGMLRFSKNQRATEVWQDIRDGFLKNISIGYRVNKWEEQDDSDVVRVTRWTLFEASVVSVPADPSVGVNRSQQEITMSEQEENGPAPVETRSEDEDNKINVIAFQQARKEALLEGEKNAERKLLKRIADIGELFIPFIGRGPAFISLRDELVKRGATIEAARTALFDMFAGDPEPLAVEFRQAEGSMNTEEEQVQVIRTPQGRRKELVEVGKDGAEQMIDGMRQCLLVRSSLIKEEDQVKEARKSEFLSMSCADMARHYLVSRSVSVAGMNRSAIIGAALTTTGLLASRGLISHSTSDFANLLEDVANKAAGIGYNEAPETWQAWCRIGTIADFKQANRPNMSAFGDLDLVGEDTEYKYGTFSDKKEVLTLGTYGKLFSISRQALVNDDLNVFTRIPQAMGRAAARVPGDLAYNSLINGITVAMNEDAKALFHADHSNFVAGGSGAAPSVATIDAAKTAMAIQTDPSGSAVLNISLGFMIVPKALESTTKQIQMAEKDPAIASGEMPNVLRGTFETVADARLDSDDPLKWYAAANPNLFDTVEVAFLDGQQSPFLETQNGWSVDGVAFKVRLDAAAAPLDYRGLYHNDGN